MIQRPQLLALAVIVIAVAALFILVADAGVSTSVYSANPTAIPPTPTATPVPEPSAANWVVAGPSQMAYSDPSIQASIDYGESPLDTFLTQNGLEVTPEGSAFPLLHALEQIKISFDDQINGLGLDPATITTQGPAIELSGGENNTGVANLRYVIQPGTRTDGSAFGGAEIVFSLVGIGENRIIFARYQLIGEPNPTVYGDFRAWLANHITETLAASTPDEPADEAGDADEAEATAPDTETEEADATAEPGASE